MKFSFFVAAWVFVLTGCGRGNVATARLSSEEWQAASPNIDEDIASDERATRTHPGSARAWWRLALAYEKREDWSGMANASARAAQVSEHEASKGRHGDYYFGCGYALEKLAENGIGSWDAPRAPFETAIAIDPNYSRAYRELGWTLLHEDDEYGAIRSFTRAVEAKPDDLTNYIALADAYRRLQMYGAAEEVLEEGITFAQPDDRHLVDVHELLGEILETQGTILRGRRLQLSPDAAGELAYAKNLRFGRAIKEYQAAEEACELSGCTDYRESHFAVGRTYSEMVPAMIPALNDQAADNLQEFWHLACQGDLAAKYAADCEQTLRIAHRIGRAIE